MRSQSRYVRGMSIIIRALPKLMKGWLGWHSSSESGFENWAGVPVGAGVLSLRDLRDEDLDHVLAVPVTRLGVRRDFREISVS